MGYIISQKTIQKYMKKTLFDFEEANRWYKYQ